MDKSLDEMLEGVSPTVRDAINKLIVDTVAAETELKVQHERSKFTAETDQLRSKIKVIKDELEASRLQRPGTAGLTRTGKSSTASSKIPGINRGPFEQSKSTAKSGANPDGSVSASSSGSVRNRITQGFSKIMPRQSNISNQSTGTLKKSARGDDKPGLKKPSGLQVPTKANANGRGASAQKKGQEDSGKVDMNADPVGLSLKKRTKDGRVYPDAVREIGMKPKVEQVFKLKQSGQKLATKENSQADIKQVVEKDIASKFKDDPIDKSITLRKQQPGEQVTAVVKEKGAKVVEEKHFKLSLKGGQPKLKDAPKTDPKLGKQVGGKEDQNIPKEKCPIEVSIALRKKQPGEQVTNVVKSDKLSEENQFKLSLKGGQPQLKDAPKGDPSLGSKKDTGQKDQNIPKEPCAIEVSIVLRKKQPGETLLSTVPAKDLKLPEIITFKLSQKGEQPKLDESKKVDPKLGQRIEAEGSPQKQSTFKGEDPINSSLKIRKSEPGEQVTAVVKSAKPSQDPVVFQLKLKGDGPKLREEPVVDPSLGQKIGGQDEKEVPKEACPIEVSLRVRKKEPGEQITAVVKSAKQDDNEPIFQLKFKGDEPNLKQAPKHDPRLGKRADADQIEENKVNTGQKCDIMQSIASRLESGHITDVVPKKDAELAQDVVFSLKMKGDQLNLANGQQNEENKA